MRGAFPFFTFIDNAFGPKGVAEGLEGGVEIGATIFNGHVKTNTTERITVMSGW